jgi:hypothetical protein
VFVIRFFFLNNVPTIILLYILVDKVTLTPKADKGLSSTNDKSKANDTGDSTNDNTTNSIDTKEDISDKKMASMLNQIFKDE